VLAGTGALSRVRLEAALRALNGSPGSGALAVAMRMCILVLVIVSYQESVASIVEPGIGYRFVN
jgi:hypothetical protein